MNATTLPSEPSRRVLDMSSNSSLSARSEATAQGRDRVEPPMASPRQMKSTDALRFEGVCKRYGNIRALDGIELSVKTGSVLALLGPNGAGKSTLFGCLLGTVHAQHGAILYHDEPINDAHRSGFGYVSERVALYSQRTVRENGVFFTRLRNHDFSDFEHQLTRVGLESVQDRKVRQLSKGMLQRLGLAIALCGSPEILVLDEPFNGLDPALLTGLQRILREENERGATLLISTHTMSAIEPLATVVAILLQGRLASAGSLDSLREQHPRESSLEEIYHIIASKVSRSPEEVITL